MQSIAAAPERSVLSTTVVDGVEAYSPAQLFAAYRSQLGRPITRASAQAILTEIEALYRRDGYSRPEFQLDDDLVGNGILRIEVFEPQLTQIELNGTAGPYGAELQSWSDELRMAGPLHVARLQAELHRLRELPGLTVRATTRRDPQRRNGYVLAIDVRYKPVDVLVQASNRGTEEIGPHFGFARIVGNNLLGLRERVGVLFSAANDYQEHHGGGMFLDAPFGANETRVVTSAFISRSDPTEPLDRDARYLRERASLRVIQPLSVLADDALSFSAGVEWDDLELRRSGQRLREERLRVVELGARLSGHSSPTSQYLLAMQLRQGLDGLGSRLDARDLVYDPRRTDFLALRLQLTHATRFAKRWSVRVDALGQQSAYVLPDSERYKIGGERLGRGFEVAEIAGDRGIGAKAELRRMLGNTSSESTRASVYGFYDFAAAWKQNVPGRESAATSGVGLALEYGAVSGSIELARPLTHADVEGERNAKVFAELRLKL